MKRGTLSGGLPRFPGDVQMFVPEQVLPLQWYGQARHLTREQRLQLAVLEQAVREWGWVVGEVRVNLERWFRDRTPTRHPYSLEGICESLKWDADWVWARVQLLPMGKAGWRVHRGPTSLRLGVVA